VYVPLPLPSTHKHTTHWCRHSCVTAPVCVWVLKNDMRMPVLQVITQTHPHRHTTSSVQQNRAGLRMSSRSPVMPHIAAVTLSHTDAGTSVRPGPVSCVGSHKCHKWHHCAGPVDTHTHNSSCIFLHL